MKQELIKDQVLEVDQDIDFEDLKNKKKENFYVLKVLDHSQIDYQPFKKCFYDEHDHIKALSEEQGEQIRRDMGIKVRGGCVPKPIVSFGHLNFDE